MKTRLLSLFVAFLATTALWAYDFQFGGLYYNITSSSEPYTVKVSDAVSYITTANIPATVTDNGTTYSVTSIGDYAFYDCSSLTSVTIPNSVTSIGKYAFEYCSSLTSVVWNAKNVAGFSSDSYAPFYNICSNITSFTFGDSVQHIPAYMCDGMNNLTSITIPNSVTSIGSSAFRDCTGLTSITIPNSVTSIGSNVFYGCSSLTSITIPNSVKSIGSSAFYRCSSLTSVTIPNSVTSIEYYAFYRCSSLTSVTIPNSVTSIEKCAFSGCSSLTSITIPNSVTSIGYDAFRDCSSLTSVTIGNSVTSIGYNAFSDCSSLTSVTIGNSVTSIEAYAFYECSSLTSVTIGNSVTSIEDCAFCRCSSLTSITIPNSVTSIGGYAFSDCSSLTSVTIPNSVTSIGRYAFYNCSSLTSITIPESVTTIGEGATFQKCTSLKSVQWNAIHCTMNKYSGGYLLPFDSLDSITNFVFGDKVTTIPVYLCYGLSGLNSITSWAETPPTLGSNVFYNVSTAIPVYVACGQVDAYKSANGWSSFSNIQDPLAEYTITVKVNDTIMGAAKVDKNTLCGAQISATPQVGSYFTQWSDGVTDNPRTLTLTQDTVLTAEFAQYFSGQCGDNLYWAYNEANTTLSITGSGEMYDYTQSTQPWLLFQEQITEVTTSNSTTSFGEYAFAGCARLSKLQLGTGIENIAANAFAECKRLYDIYCYATYPPFAEESSFANYNVYVYIPCESQRDYILDVIWGKFKFIECIESEEATTDGNVTVVPGLNDVTITWPTSENADTYSLVINKDGKPFCTLTFDKDGRLLNIAFAPGRNGNRPAQYAEQAANGYRFTVTGLTEATQYAYNITTKDAANQTIATYSGEFTTNSTTDLENINNQYQITDTRKEMRNGQLIIIRDGKTYTIMGQELK